MLDGVLVGAVVNGLIEQHGGLQDFLSQFEKQALGATVKSWVAMVPQRPQPLSQWQSSRRS